jgi:hypothetical protein
MFAVALLMLGGCGSTPDGSAVAMPKPSPGDVQGQIMSVTGAGFTICSVSDDIQPSKPPQYDVIVCGSVSKARAALETRFPGECLLSAYQPGDGGSHTPQELVMQWWIDRITGPGFVVTSTEINDDGTIDVGVDGDLKVAKAVLDRQFPGRTEVHAQAVVPAM